MATRGVTHRARVETCLSGEVPDRIPFALWRHFPVDDQSPGLLADATLDFQRAYDFDLVKVTPSSSYCVKDWGADDEWRGASEGTREYTRRVIDQPDDWKRLRPLDPNRGFLADQLECLRLITRTLGAEVPVLQTIFNPLSQAKNLAGQATLLVHLRRYPEAVHEGLKTITESIQRFLEAAGQTGIAGMFFAVQHAQFGLMSEQEYATFGRAYDLKILEQRDNFWLNMLHLHGEQVMFDLFLDYPVEVINWHDRESLPALADAQQRFEGALCGGLRRWESMVLGTPEKVNEEAHDAILATGGRRFILGTGCVLPIIAPRANVLAARQATG